MFSKMHSKLGFLVNCKAKVNLLECQPKATFNINMKEFVLKQECSCSIRWTVPPEDCTKMPKIL